MADDNGLTWTELEEKLKRLSSRLPKIISRENVSDTSKTALKVYLIHASLLYRYHDLAKNSVSLSKERAIVPALILARAAFETAALLFYTYTKIDTVVKSRDIGEIDDILMRIMFGKRQQQIPGDTDISAINILTVIDLLDKEMGKLSVQGIRGLYDNLCEFAHPNFCGAFGSYADTAEDNPFHCAFGIEPECLNADMPLSFLYTSLLILEAYDDELTKILPIFTKLHESSKPQNDEYK
jgi:hypothetical protein